MNPETLTVVAALGGIVLLVNGIKAFQFLLSPVKKISEVERREVAHEKDAEERFLKIETALKEQEGTNQTVLKALYHLVNHEIDGNGVDGLKRIRNELWNNISEKN